MVVDSRLTRMAIQAEVRSVALPSGETVVALGQGTWGMGEDRRRREKEIAALRLGLDLGMRLIDTAEMYGNGGAEEIVSEAIAGRRDEVFLVSKVLPHHASRRGAVAACQASLKRLGTDRLDLYLLHWREEIPLADTLEGLESLLKSGDIRYWGVSNFDKPDMEELVELEGGSTVATNQVLYNLTRRGVEFDLLPWCRGRHVPVMAYSPIEQGRLLQDSMLRAVAGRRNASPAQVALAWVLRQEGVIAIPKAANADHVRQNRAALDVRLTEEDLRDLDRAFPPPLRKVPLAML
jgi:diketogulonate reductase-like aldo/keto reductase